jgi:hypothetical protein
MFSSWSERLPNKNGVILEGITLALAFGYAGLHFAFRRIETAVFLLSPSNDLQGTKKQNISTIRRQFLPELVNMTGTSPPVGKDCHYLMTKQLPTLPPSKPIPCPPFGEKRVV